jgi:glycogen debranching enzyme
VPARVEVHEPDPLPEGAVELIPGISGHGDPRAEVPIRPPTATAVFELMVPPGRYDAITFEVLPSQGEKSPSPVADSSLDAAFSVMRQSYTEWEETCTSIVTDDEIVNAVLSRSLHDLRLLSDHVEDGYLPSAGIPWFSVPFGRDSLITSIQALCLQPDIARATLTFLARHQGQEVNDWRDEQPGKILHEIRLGELAVLGQVPHTPYYGSVDATPLFVVTLGEYLRWTGDRALVETLRPNLEAALRWIDEYGDLDGDGYVEYLCKSSRGIRNQGWKDSSDAVTHRDGKIAEPPIALAEVQGYVYAAWLAAAEIYAMLGEVAVAAKLTKRAADLSMRFRRDWWSDHEQFFAMALDNAKRPIQTVTSNVGHCLWAGLLDDECARAVGARLVRDDMLCGWGVRTLSSLESSFNPMSYHNGSVWPHDNSLIAAGFARYGHKSAVDRIFQGLFDAASYMELRRLPELYCGFQRGRERGPTLYPVACSPQAWAAGTPLLLLQSSLGLEFDCNRNEILLRNPRLPPFLDEVTLRNLHLNQSAVDLMLRRHGNDVSLQVLRNEGQIRVAAVYS